MQDEQFRRGKSSGRNPARRGAASLFGTVRARRFLPVCLCLAAAVLFTGTAVFPGTYPLGIAMAASAGGVLSAAAATVGALLGSVRIPAAGGVYALIFVGLFAVRAMASVWVT